MSESTKPAVTPPPARKDVTITLPTAQITIKVTQAEPEKKAG